MFKYFEEIDIEKIKIESLTKENYYLVKDFCCGNEVFEEFLIKKSLTDYKTRTYIFVYHNEDKKILLGYFGLSASGISIMNDGRQDIEKAKAKKFNMPAIEITHFALCEQFHHMFWDAEAEVEKEKYYLSDILLLQLLKYIISDVLLVVGASFIVLYSVPEAESLYRRSEFVSFEDFMIPDNKRYLDECIPLYLKIEYRTL